MFDAEEFYTDFSIHTASATHKHSRQGWIQIECPFCTGNPGYHLGYNLASGFYSCWRCGGHSISEVVKEFTGKNWSQVKELLKEYDTDIITTQHQGPIKRASRISLPKGSSPMKKPHKQYLRDRNFNALKLARIWGLKGTGPIGPYNYRIVAPITHNKRLVSYQARDYTGKSGLRYKACPQELEIMDHKHTLYGLDQCEGRQVVVVEGITDVWRMGPGAVCTFGIKWTTPQLSLLWERFERVYIMYDDDPQAIVQAERMANELALFPKMSVELCFIKGDPGDLNQSVADEYMGNLLGV